MTTDAPLTLADAAARFFPGGKISDHTLRGYVRQGKLRAYRVGKHYWTTDSDVREMLAECLVVPKGRVCGSVKIGMRGLSSTEPDNVALDLARRTSRELKERFANTSKANTAKS